MSRPYSGAAFTPAQWTDLWVQKWAYDTMEEIVETSDARKRRIEEAQAGAPFQSGDRVYYLDSDHTGRVVTSGPKWSYVQFDLAGDRAWSVGNAYLRKESPDEALVRLRRTLAEDYTAIKTGQIQNFKDPHAGVRKHDPVKQPEHYVSHPSGVEAITVTEHMNFCVGNAIKYLWRAGRKGDAVEDLKKARWYVDREIERLSR